MNDAIAQRAPEKRPIASVSNVNGFKEMSNVLIDALSVVPG